MLFNAVLSFPKLWQRTLPSGVVALLLMKAPRARLTSLLAAVVSKLSTFLGVRTSTAMAAVPDSKPATHVHCLSSDEDRFVINVIWCSIQVSFADCCLQQGQRHNPWNDG